MLDFSLKLFNLTDDFTSEQLEEAYKLLKKNGIKYNIYNEAYLFLKKHLTKKELDYKLDEETKVLADEIIDNYENNKLVIMNRIRNILEFINEPNKQIYLNDLKTLLRNAPFDYEKNPKYTIELWTLYSKYKDASDYNRIINKK